MKWLILTDNNDLAGKCNDFLTASNKNACMVTAADASSVTVEPLKYTDGSLPTYVIDNWTTDLPAATDAGSYNVFYKVDGNGEVDDVEPTLIGTVDIAKVTPAVNVAAADGLYETCEEQELLSLAETDFGSLQFGFSRIPDVYDNSEVNVPDLKYGDIIYPHNNSTITFAGDGAVQFENSAF